MDAVLGLGSTESIGNIIYLATTSCTGMTSTELVGLGIAGLGLFSIFPILLMALSMAWYKITGQDGWPIMIGAGLAWLGLAVYGFATSSSAWDIYQIVGAVSMSMLALCILLSYGSRETSRKAREAAKVQATVKVEPPPKDSYSKRYKNWEEGSGLKSKEQLDDERKKGRLGI